MDNPTTAPLDFSTRFRRSEGRSGRTFAASVKLTKEELAEVEQAARAAQKAVGEYARDVLLREARSARVDPLFTEVVAIRMLLNYLLKPISCGERGTPESFAAVIADVRSTKHKAAADVMAQYAVPDHKES
jgi:hypothetical protein